MLSRHVSPFVALLCVALLSVLGCGHKPVGRSELGTKSGDREVKATLDGGGFISAKDDVVTIATNVGKIVVEKDRVQFDGRELAKLPDDAKLVEVDVTAGKITIKADGTGVFSTASGQ